MTYKYPDAAACHQQLRSSSAQIICSGGEGIVLQSEERDPAESLGHAAAACWGELRCLLAFEKK